MHIKWKKHAISKFTHDHVPILIVFQKPASHVDEFSLELTHFLIM